MFSGGTAAFRKEKAPRRVHKAGGFAVKKSGQPEKCFT